MVQYFDGKSAKGYWVYASLTDDILQLKDCESGDIIDTIFINSCTTQVINRSLYIYFEKSTKYILVDALDPLLGVLQEEISKRRSMLHDKFMNQRLVGLMVFLAVLIMGIYALFLIVVPWAGLRIIDTKKEISFGKELYNEYVNDMQINPVSSQIVQEFANDLHLSNTFPITVTVVNDSTINAFALPGGNIIIYTGILNKLHSYEELAALLGHESTHINERHGMKSILRSISSTFLFSLILHDGGNLSGVLLRNADQLRGLSFSRNLEEDADKKGMELLIRNHIDPTGMKDLMLELQNTNAEVPDAISFLSTHPLTKERIRSADRFLLKHRTIPIGTHDELVTLWNELKDQ